MGINMHTNKVSNADPLRCMKCGFCMSVCPVYQLDYTETKVARGRNILIRMASQNGLSKEQSYLDCLDSCMLCKRCEAVCPARLSPAEITIQAKNKRLQQTGKSWIDGYLKRFLMGNRTYLARGLGLTSLLPGLRKQSGRPLRHLADSFSLIRNNISLPSSLFSPFLPSLLPKKITPDPGIPEKGTIAFFPGCQFEFFQPETGKQLVKSLAAVGYTVVYPDDLGCCGLAVYSTGDLDTARKMARKNYHQLAKFEYIVTGCATCGAALKRYPKWLSHTTHSEDISSEKLHEFRRKIVDYSELLGQSTPKSPAKLTKPLRITYHDPCHLRVEQGIYEEPRKFLNQLKPFTFVEMDRADSCCGMAGVFGFKNRNISLALQKEKIQSIKRSKAHIVVTSCPGCVLGLKDGLKRHGVKVVVKHIGELT